MIARDQLHVYVERHFDATAEQVFDAWLDPAMLRRWIFGPAVREEDIVRVSVDPHVGGAFAFVVRRHDQEISQVGRFLHLNRPRRLLFTWGIASVSEDQSRVVVDLVSTGTGCELSLAHELRPNLALSAARMESGWDRAFDRLVLALAQ